MAWRLDKSVVRGEIDNRVRGCVTGRIWLTSIEDPVQLKLEGNCWRDLAGCHLTFKNPKAAPDTSENVNLHPEQNGMVGENGYKDYPMAVAMLKRTLSYFNEGIEHSQIFPRNAEK